MLKKTLISLFVTLSLVCVTFSQEANIEGLDKANVNTPVWLKLNLPENAVGKFDSHFLDVDPTHVAPGAALFITSVPGEYRIVAVSVVDKDISFVEKTIVIVGGPPVSNDITLSTENILKWLETVPVEVRAETITNPLTEEVLTRQKAIGQTFLNIGKGGEAIGSIPGLELMLSTALSTLLGDNSEAWQSFADKIDTGLSVIKDANSTVVEYANAYILIGETLINE